MRAPSNRLHPLIQLHQSQTVVWDGAMGTQTHGLDLDIEQDYWGCENCTDILSLSCPDQIRAIHMMYLEAGADVISTNTFGAAAHVLGEFDRADDSRKLCKAAAEIARSAADEFSVGDSDRFVAGSLGPGTKLITLGQIGFEAMRESYAVAASGLIEGGVDAVLIETCQDLLQIRCAVQGVVSAADQLGVDLEDVPIFVSVTIEQSGTMLMGSTIEAAIEAMRPLRIAGLGLNCATGPREMMSHIRVLASRWDRLITVMPNAGLPELCRGQSVYPLDPVGFADAVKPLIEEGLADGIGGCCGTTPKHIEQLRCSLKTIPRKKRADPVITPSCTSLYSSVEYRQDLSFLIIGERCNASGSRRFKRLLEEDDFESIVSMAREQGRDGSHVLDINVDVAGRDNPRDMHEVVSRIVRQVDAPLMLDSTNPDVILSGLQAAPGKCIVNSANFEEGDDRFDRLCSMARDYGAGLVIGTIDEDLEHAMARTAERKLAIAERGIDRASRVHGMELADLFIDPLVLPVSTGMEADRRSALELIEGTRLISEAFPEVQLTCGLSNVSFGLLPRARVVLNAVLLDLLIKAGMTSSIVHATKITPLHTIGQELKVAALDLLMDRRGGDRGWTGLPERIDEFDHDPLAHFIGLFADGVERPKDQDLENRSTEELLRFHIVDGELDGLEGTIGSALELYDPMEIINGHLLDGMKAVGELFGNGQMQLPFVLQSAEVMKRAVSLLEPHMESDRTDTKGTIVLATVKGDVHDIGKNLVDILLSNNGYTVRNLGIKQPIDSILAAFHESDAHAIGLSGLLVKSVNVMEENLRALNDSGVRVPVLLGGAALSRSYAEGHLRGVYQGELHYAKDAFDGLSTMDAIVQGKGGELLDEAQERVNKRMKVIERAGVARDQDTSKEASAVDSVLLRSNASRGHGVPTPPFWGSRVIKGVDLDEIFQLINPTALFRVQWQLRRGTMSKSEYGRLLDDVAWPKFEQLKAACHERTILIPGVVYGYFPCSSAGETLYIFDPDDHDKEIERFEFPRQAGNKRLCIADYYRDREECRTLGGRDVLPMMCVTMGEEISRFTRGLFENDKYQDYLYWHGIGVEAAEGLAELWHRQIRSDLGFVGEDAEDVSELFRQGYRGSRYSFGYPACPDMSQHRTMWRLLEPARIGCELTENDQIDPEQSTCAIVSHHPEARYFNT